MRQELIPSPILMSVLYALADGIVVVDAAGHFVVWNASAEAMLGAPPASGLIDAPPEQFGFYLTDKSTPVSRDESPFVRAMFGESVNHTLFFLRNPRSPLGIWVDVSVSPIVLGDAFQGGVVMLRDVTRERLSDQSGAAARYESQRSEEKFRTIVTNIPGVVYRSEAAVSRGLRFVTDQVRELTGRPAAEFLDHRVSLSDLVDPEDADVVRRQVEDAVAARKPYVVEYRLRHADGSTRWVLDKGRPVFGEDGKPLWLDGVLFDLSERKAAESAVLQKTRELATADAERDQLKLFAYVASHDLREPLQKILCFGDLLKMQAATLDDKCKDMVDRMQSASMRMGQLLDDILRFTKAGSQADPLRPVDLDGVLGEVVDDLEVRIRNSGAKIDVGPLPRVSADRGQVRQMFQNLVANAIKFAPKGSCPEVFVRAEADEGQFAVIAVEDRGIGFDLKDKDKIFRPFERLHRREDYEGSGLGLSICQKIAARHGGQIRVDSVPGKGTTFRVLLPLAA